MDRVTIDLALYLLAALQIGFLLEIWMIRTELKHHRGLSRRYRDLEKWRNVLEKDPDDTVAYTEMLRIRQELIEEGEVVRLDN